MFEITYSDSEIFEDYQYAGKAHKGGTYDFTFENRYLIYHASLRREVNYIAIDMTTGLSSSVITKAPGNYYTKESYRKLIPHILYSVKYTGDVRYLNRFADNPLEVIDSIFRVVLPNNGYHIREEQISLAKQMYIGFTEKQIALCEAEVGTGKTLAGYDTICMTRSNKSAIADFKKSKNGILFASGSMWEGVDCVGDCLSSVIIVRLPFPMRSALMEEKKDACASVADFVDRYCTPNMLIKLRQGVGRLIRCESDTGVVSILDPRAASKSYASKIDHALHKYPKVDSTEEIERFMRSIKHESYYAEKKEK